MLIDWFTVAAQAINFLLLVLVLKYVLYKPLRRAMNERKQRIAKDLEQAENSRKEAAAQKSKLEEARDNLDQERRQVLDKAKEEAGRYREQAMEKARQEVDEQRRQWRQALQEERDAFARTLTTRIAEATLSVCRKALHDLADAELQDRLAAKMLELLPQNGGLAPREVQVRTGFPPNDALQERLQKDLQKHWPSLESVEFQQDASLGFGIECRFEGDKVAWNAQRYISGLEERVMDVFAKLPDNPEAPDRQKANHGAADASEEETPSTANNSE